jgi:hypothetical protein
MFVDVSHIKIGSLYIYLLHESQHSYASIRVNLYPYISFISSFYEGYILHSMPRIINASPIILGFASASWNEKWPPTTF